MGDKARAAAAAALNRKRWDLDGQSGTTPIQRRQERGDGGPSGADTIPDLVRPSGIRRPASDAQSDTAKMRYEGEPVARTRGSNAETIPAGRKRRRDFEAREVRNQSGLKRRPVDIRPSHQLHWQEFVSQLDRHLEQVELEGSEVALLLLDIDYFELVSTHYGASEAERLAAQLEQLSRQGLPDARGRGCRTPSSLAVFFVGQSRDRVQRSGERLLALVRAEMALGAGCPMTVSIGCAFSAEGTAKSSGQLLAMAEQRLSEAVQSGGDRLVAMGTFD